MEVQTLGVVGAGLMGNGIAQVAAMSGLQVIMSDIQDEFVQRGLKNINKILSRSVDKGRMSVEEKDAILDRIKTTVDNKDMSAVDFEENEKVTLKILPSQIAGEKTSTSTIKVSAQVKRIEAQKKQLAIIFLSEIDH